MSAISRPSRRTNSVHPLQDFEPRLRSRLAASDRSTRDTALRQIVFSVDRTTRLVRQLLTIARLDSEPKTPMKPVRVGDVVQEMLDSLPPADKEADVTIDPVLRTTVVPTSREALLLAIRNLHENAVRHMAQRGSIRWSLKRPKTA